MIRTGCLLAAAAVALLMALTGRAAARDTSVYTGLGAWVDIYDHALWQNPEQTVAQLQARGVGTLYLETSNSDQAVDVVAADKAGRFIDAAHASGMAIVAWYLPELRNPSLDRRRVLKALQLRSVLGESFDSVALDIESSAVTPAGERTKRLLALAAELRRAAGEAYALGAIVPPPVGIDLHPRYWPGFPYKQLRALFDVFLPMTYFTHRTRGEGDTEAYVVANVTLLRLRSGDPELPVHVIGGIASHTKPTQLKGFLAGSCGAVIDGISLYDFATMKPWQWRAVRSPCP